MKQGREGSGGPEPRLLRALVRLFPRSFREQFGDDVLRTLSAAHRAASASGVRNWNVADNASVPASRRDYELARDGLSTITDLSAVEVEERNVAVGAGPGQPETLANVTASTFALTRVPTLMGRTLLEADERGGAEEVVVVGYDFWKTKLAGAADAVGRVIRISGTPVTIVGVMPRGYGFPQRNGVWRPLHFERIPEASPSLRYVFGRLAPGRTRDEATAEVAAIGARAATTFPETNKNVRLHVLSLPDAVSDLSAEAALVLACRSRRAAQRLEPPAKATHRRRLWNDIRPNQYSTGLV